jgi:glyoxylase-like metal-dependent hydrolase (beta-lactamase superfamily II)
MSNTRRHFIAQASALAAAAALTPAAWAGASLGGTMQTSIHRMKLGAFEVTTLLDGFIDLNPAILIGDADLIKRHLEAAGLWGSPIRTSVNAFLVNTGDKLVLIDCGGGKFLGPNAGRLPQALALAGVEPWQIDEVCISHMHGDHLHGAVTPEGEMMFPNATLRIGKADVAFWGSAAEEAAAPADQKGRFMPAKRAIAAYGNKLQTFEPGAMIVPGIQAINATGHTPGHTVYMVSSGSARLMLLGDTMHVAPVQFPRPEITVAFDSNRDGARALRRQLFQMAANENMLIGAVHLPFPGIGRLREKDGAFSYEALPWQMF